MNARTDSGTPQIYHHHWVAYWREASGISLLIVLGVASILVWQPLCLGFWLGALAWCGALYLHWNWHTFTFTPDSRLICRRGFMGSARDVVSLFGVVTPYQPPILGRWLDVGSVRMYPFGGELHIRHIASFAAFEQRLLYGAQRQEPRAESPVQIVVQLPPAPDGASWPPRLSPERPQTALDGQRATEQGALTHTEAQAYRTVERQVDYETSADTG
jgi:hypothetical protein